MAHSIWKRGGFVLNGVPFAMGVNVSHLRFAASLDTTVAAVFESGGVRVCYEQQQHPGRYTTVVMFKWSRRHNVTKLLREYPADHEIMLDWADTYEGKYTSKEFENAEECIEWLVSKGG